jgi:divalent metal cation (Fe/Co/Zn/Cd) transporter
VGFLVGINIAVTGARLLRDSVDGLMDHAWSRQETAELGRVLAPFVSPEVSIHGIRTRAAGHARFADLHLLVPGEWTVHRSHQLADEIERHVAARLADVRLMCHVEPLEDPSSYSDFDAEADVFGPEEDPE